MPLRMQERWVNMGPVAGVINQDHRGNGDAPEKVQAQQSLITGRVVLRS